MNVREKLGALKSITEEQQEYGAEQLRSMGVDDDDGTIEGNNDNITAVGGKINDNVISTESTWSSSKINTALNANSNAISAEATTRRIAIEEEAAARDAAISDAIADEVTARNAAINQATASMWTIKGRVDTVSDLPASGNKANDVYQVGLEGASDFAEYYWTGTRWEYMGTTTGMDPTNYYTIGQVDALLGNKQNALTFDNAPTENSANPVTSAGIKTAIDTKQDTLTPGENITIEEDPTTGELVISSTASGGGGSDQVQIYRSKDFPEMPGGYKYVKFNGSNKGKILLIKPDIEEGDVVAYNQDFLYAGRNCIIPAIDFTVTYNANTVTMYSDNGITVTYEMQTGKYTVTGTATSNTGISLAFASYAYMKQIPLYVKCFGLTGSYENAKVCATTSHNYYYTSNQHDLTEVWSFYNNTSSYGGLPIHVGLNLISGETYDFSFYLQISFDVDELDVYERPFNILKMLSLLCSSSQWSTSTVKVFGNQYNNNVCANYPIVHEGINYIIERQHDTYYNKDFIVYYIPEYADSSYDIALKQSELISGVTDKSYTAGSKQITSSSTVNDRYVMYNFPMCAIPSEYIMVTQANTAFTYSTVNFAHSYAEQKLKRNFEKYDFGDSTSYRSRNYTEAYSGVRVGFYLSSGNYTFYYQGFFSWDGWTDKTTVSPEDTSTTINI